MTEDQSPTQELDRIEEQAREYFRDALEDWKQEYGDSPYSVPKDVNSFIRSLRPQLAKRLESLESRITDWAANLAEMTRSAPLSSGAHQGELRIKTRKMIAALRFREYEYYETHLLGWEDQVYGVEPATQNERDTFPTQAPELFSDATRRIRHLLLFLKGHDAQGLEPPYRMKAVSGTHQRHDTAFIMMWMSEDHPELEDVKQGIKDVFGEFGITAIRADEIEHEGVITERVLQVSVSRFISAR
ncbi:MAG: hypothetical protein ABSD59_16780 [Terracidiphilus sp.]|jgi:hypothetical protein